MEDGQEQCHVGQHLREARHDVGEAHDGQVVVADVADLVRQHARELGGSRRRNSPSVMPITALSGVPVAKAFSVMLGMM